MKPNVLESFYAFKPSKAIKKSSFFKTDSDTCILTSSHYSFGHPEVQVVDHNPMREWFEFEWRLVTEADIIQRKW